MQNKASANSKVAQAPSTANAVPLVSLRLGHARALTPPRGVIHSPRAASLPTGEGFGLCAALTLCAAA